MKALVLGFAVILSSYTPAAAHSPVPGIEGFYLGLLHPFSTPSHALLMIGLGIVAGGFDIKAVRLMLLVFSGVMVCTLLAGQPNSVPETAVFAAAILISSVAALNVNRLFPVAVVLAIFGGILVGLISIPDDSPGRGRTVTMVGSFIGANVSLLYLAGARIILKEKFAAFWVSIAFRVAAAWVAAISAIMLAILFAPDTAATETINIGEA